MKQISTLKSVVGIGASAGGIEALKALFSSLPPATGMAFVVIQHTEPHHSPLLSEVISHTTSMLVQQAIEGMALLPNQVFTAPAESDLAVEEGKLRLIPRGFTHRLHLPIDTFFCSLAEAYGPKAIGVVLSGTGSDGTVGIADIKNQGGTTFAQDERTAKHGNMPQSAIASGNVDYILSPDQIATQLAELSKNSSLPMDDPSAVKEILLLLKKKFEVDFSEYKQTTVSRRIHKRRLATRSESLVDYLSILRKRTDELEALYKDVLINVTSFFRDPETFDALQRHILPKLTEGRHTDDPLRIWVPGCASGEEVYSLAFSVAEYGAKVGKQFPMQIFGTDISEHALDTAREGIFPPSISKVISSKRIKTFFEPVGNSYQVKKSIRESCIFARHNVIADPPLSKMDLISCRNLLIYFGLALQERMIPIFHYALKPQNGFLVLGKSELVDIFSDFFVPVDKTHRFYKKKGTTSRISFTPIPGHRIAIKTDIPRPMVTRETRRDAESEIHKETDRFFLANYVPPAVVLTENSDIIQFRGHTAPYLDPSGRASFNLFKMLHPDLLQPVRKALEKVKTGNARSILCTQLRYKSSGEYKLVDIRIVPLKTQALKEAYFLVIFEEPSPTEVKPSQKEPRRKLNLSEVASYSETDEVRRLSEELDAARQHLQAVIDDRETGFEELQAANEEVVSSNEELQTINQELETAKEELESSNEELTTLNEQLRQSMDDLSKSEEHFRALVSGVKDYAIFMLDPKGYILSWNVGAERISGYSKQEIIGEHVSIFYPEGSKRNGKAEQELRTAATTGRFTEEGIRIKKDGSSFLANVIITPIYNEQGVLTGFAKVTRDITAVRLAEDKLRESELRFRRLISVVKDYAIFMLDPTGRVMSWNEGAERINGYTPDEIIGQHFSIFYPRRDVEDGKTERELRIAQEKGVYEEEGFRVRKDGSTFWANVVITAIRDEKGELIGFTKVTRDLTERREVEARLRASEERNRLVIATAHDAFVAMNEQGTITDWNPQAEKLFGWTKEEAIGKHLPETLVPEKYRDQHAKGFARFMKTGVGPILGKRVELSALHKNGYEFPVELTISPIKIGSEILFGSFIHDISERKRAEEALRESEGRIKSLAKFPSERPAPVMRVSPDGKLLYSNAASEPLLNLWGPENRIPKDVQQRITETLSSSVVSELEVHTKDKRIYALSLVPVKEENYVNIYGTDVTKLKAAEEALRKSKDELESKVIERTQELVAINERLATSNSELERFAFVASHDLQEPLRMISSYLQFIEKGIQDKLSAKEKLFMEYAVEGSTRMKALVEDLLAYARLGRGEEERVQLDFNLALAEAINNLKAAVDEGNAHITSDTLPTLRAVRLQIIQLFQNLLSNAIKYHSDRPLQIHISYKEEPGRYVFCVQDNGIGIEPQYLERIFIVFQRLHSDRKKYPGTGIGLAICKRIVERHDGRIWVESTPNEGATFCFSLPKQ